MGTTLIRVFPGNFNNYTTMLLLLKIKFLKINFEALNILFLSYILKYFSSTNFHINFLSIYFLKIFEKLKKLILPIFSLFLRQQTICLFSKNGLKSILVRHFFGTFSAIMTNLQITCIFQCFSSFSLYWSLFLN